MRSTRVITRVTTEKHDQYVSHLSSAIVSPVEAATMVAATGNAVPTPTTASRFRAAGNMVKTPAKNQMCPALTAPSTRVASQPSAARTVGSISGVMYYTYRYAYLYPPYRTK